jgi:hypothetical protein
MTRIEPGPIAISARSEPALVSHDPPGNRLESVGEGAAQGTRLALDEFEIDHSRLDKVVGYLGINPAQVDAVFSVLGFALTPFAATYGAIASWKARVSPGEVSAEERELDELMRSIAAPKLLSRKVAESAHLRTRRTLVGDGAVPATVAGPPASATLEIVLDKFLLKAAKSSKENFFLYIEARARLKRSTNGSFVFSRTYHYESGPALFVDWERRGGLESAADTGYHTIAEKIAADVFEPPSEPPLLIGPGHKHSQARIKPNDQARTGADLRFSTPSLRADLIAAGKKRIRLAAVGRGPLVIRSQRRCSFAQVREPPESVRSDENTNTQPLSPTAEQPARLEIYTRSRNLPQRFLAPADEISADRGDGGHVVTDRDFDGLPNDRNAVVSVIAIMAAIPVGFWDQTVGVITKQLHESPDRLTANLHDVAARSHFEEHLADEVARRLQAQGVGPVQRTDDPAYRALVDPTTENSSKAPDQGSPAGSKTSLELQVVSTRLVGKLPHGRTRALSVDIQATVIRTSDGQELYSLPIRYLSKERKLKDWADADAKLFRQELEECTHEAAQSLAQELSTHRFPF